MATLPSALSLANIADGSQIIAVDHRNNYAAIQARVNELLDILDGGALGQVLTSGGGTSVDWVAAPVAAEPGDLIWAATRTRAGCLKCDGSAVSRATYAALFAAIVPVIGTFTVTIASPGVFTLTAHGLVIGDRVYLTTTGALPTGLSQNTIYYVVSTPSADTFTLSATEGGAAINTSGSQSGTHTLRSCPYGLGDGSTTFNVPDAPGRMLVVPGGAGGNAKVRAPGQHEGAALANRQPDHFHPSPLFQTGGSFNTGNILFNDAADGNSPTVNVGDTSGPQDGPAYMAANLFIKT